MATPILVSGQGSDRATGYDLSCKILRRGTDLVLGWLEAPVRSGAMARVMLGVADPATGALQGALCLAEGIDNHCGPALALAPDGRLHFMSGAHHGDFLYRWIDADNPLALNHWSDPVPVGPRASYPSLVCDATGTLHLAYRESNPDRWRLVYRRLPPGGTWSPPLYLAESPVPGYNHFMQSVALGPSGVLHLVFQFHYSFTGNAIDCQTYAGVHISTRDSGQTWQADDGTDIALPITVETAQPFIEAPAGGMRICSIVQDAQERPWIYVVHPDTPSGLICHWEDSEVVQHAPHPALASFDMRGGRSMALAFDAAGFLHFLFAHHPQGQKTPWFDPSQELHHIRIHPADPASDPEVACLTRDPDTAHWLSVLEAPVSPHPGGLWYMWTQGNNLGGIGGDNANALKTRVWLDRLVTGTA